MNDEQEGWAGDPHRWRTVAILVGAYVVAFLDRQILSLLVEPLKREMQLSDTQVSLLQGFVFALFLVFAGLPIGCAVDRGRRPRIIAFGMTAWSLLTAACGFAVNYAGLLVARIGVGVGEAALTPAAHAMIADSFPRRRLGLALGVFGLGSYVGAGAALVLGAALLSRLPPDGLRLAAGLEPVPAWRLVFVAVGAPGVLVALIVGRMKDPPRRRGRAAAPDLAALRAYVRSHGPAMGLVNLTAAFAAMATYAANAWTPSFLIRTYHWSAPQAGLAFGLVTIAAGVGGVIGGGLLSDWATRRISAAGRLLVMAAAALVAAPFAACAPLAGAAASSLMLILPASLFTTMCLGVLPAAQQAIAPTHLRGSVAAAGFLTVNLIGLGLGPTVVALVTDRVFHDPAKLRYALAVLSPLMLATAAVLGAIAAAFYRRLALKASDAVHGATTASISAVMASDTSRSGR
jgi:MFS family permease